MSEGEKLVANTLPIVVALETEATYQAPATTYATVRRTAVLIKQLYGALDYARNLIGPDEIIDAALKSARG